MADVDVEVRAVVDEFIDGLTVRPLGGDEFEAQTPEWHGDPLFGGVIVGQALSAAVQTVDADRLPHSFHGYFLRPARVGVPLRLQVERVRDGRMFSTRRVSMIQDGKVAFSMMSSFHTGGDYPPYQAPFPDGIPAPEDIEEGERWGEGPFPLEFREVGATEPGPGGYRASTLRTWMRLAASAPDDLLVNAVILAYDTDMTRTSGRPHRLDGDTTGMISLDHSVWFHRAVRADEWLLFDVHALIGANGRTFLRGTMHTREGDLAVSMAQEMVILAL